MNVDFVVHAFGGAVADDVCATGETIVVRVVPPDTCAYNVAETLSRAKSVGDVTMHADGNDLIVTVHAAKDTALALINETARVDRRLKQHMMDKPVPPGLKNVVDRIAQSMCCDLPSDACCACTFENTPVLFRIVAPMAKGARISEIDLACVNQKVVSHGGTTDVFAASGRMFVRCSVPVSLKRKRKG